MYLDEYFEIVIFLTLLWVCFPNFRLLVKPKRKPEVTNVSKTTAAQSKQINPASGLQLNIRPRPNSHFVQLSLKLDTTCRALLRNLVHHSCRRSQPKRFPSQHLRRHCHPSQTGRPSRLPHHWSSLRTVLMTDSF